MGDSAKTDKAPKTSFFKGVKTEFNKITWPDKDTMVKQTIAVACASVVLGVVIAILDFIIQYGIDILTTFN